MSVLFPPFPGLLHMPFDLFLHILIGYTVGRVLFGTRGWAGALGGLVPNLDYPLQKWTPVPVTHGGIFHTPLFALVVLALAYAVGERRVPVLAAFLLGFLLELSVDMLQVTPGIMLAYPLTTARLSLSLPFSELYWGSLLYLACYWALSKRPKTPWRHLHTVWHTSPPREPGRE